MTDYVNDEIPDKERVRRESLIREAKRRLDVMLSVIKHPDTTGWSEITDDEINEIHDLLMVLTEAKFGRDSDGGLPLRFEIINATKHFRSTRLTDIPHEINTVEDYVHVLRLMALDVHATANQLRLRAELFEDRILSGQFPELDKE